MERAELQTAWDEIVGEVLVCLVSFNAERLEQLVSAAGDFRTRISAASPDQVRSFVAALSGGRDPLEPLRRALEGTWNNLIVLRAVCRPDRSLIEYVAPLNHAACLQEVGCGVD